MKFIQWATGWLIGLRVLFWVAVIVVGFFYASEIGGFLEGAVDRFDYAIGYPGSE
jgi:hypothetical protein